MTMRSRDWLLATWLLAVTALAGWTAWDRIQAGTRARAGLKELTVERINVV